MSIKADRSALSSRAKRQNLEGVETVWFSLRMPRHLHEDLRAKAFQERKSISLAITELLERGLKEEQKD